jgi:hypothetical protein
MNARPIVAVSRDRLAAARRKIIRLERTNRRQLGIIARRAMAPFD